MNKEQLMIERLKTPKPQILGPAALSAQERNMLNDIADELWGWVDTVYATRKSKSFGSRGVRPYMARYQPQEGGRCVYINLHPYKDQAHRSKMIDFIQSEKIRKFFAKHNT